MRVHIGVCDVERELEVVVDDAEALAGEIDQAIESGTRMLWYLDSKGRKVGVPVQKIAYVTIEAGPSELSVGFG